MAALLVLSGLGPDGYAASRILARGLPSAALLLGAFVAGHGARPSAAAVVARTSPLGKGCLDRPGNGGRSRGIHASGSPATPDWFAWSAWAILLPVTTSFVLMNFTGATTYTSLSGVRREMRIAVPIQAIAAVAGVLLWIVARFV